MISVKSAALLTASIILSSLVLRPRANSSVHAGVDAVIDGNVVYEDGHLATGATVYAQPIGRPMVGIVPHAVTDEAGYFAIHLPNLWSGKFAVGAEKEDEDYPDMSKQFYSDGKFATVTIDPHHPEARVTIRLGPKAGVLLGMVTDAVTGEPLFPCVEFRRASEPNNFIRGSGLVKAKYRLLIPSDTEILVKIYLDGYAPWYYPGTTDESARRPLRLRPAEEKTVNIMLHSGASVVTGECPKGSEATHSAN